MQGTYYQWLAEDHPQAVASAPVVDSSVALSTRNRDVALTGDTGEELLGEDSYLLVRLDVPACAVTDASISADGYAHALTVSVTILKDTSLGYVVAYNDLTYAGRVIETFAQSRYNLNVFIQTYIVIALLYLLVNWALGALARWLEVRTR